MKNSRLDPYVIVALTVSFSCLIAAKAFPATVIPVSHDMLYGGRGTWAYWDGSYDSPNNKTSYAWLSGGLGDLTDDVVASGSFNSGIENSEGTGPYVAWDLGNNLYFPEGSHPIIAFNFSGSVTIDKVSIYVGNANSGHV